MGLGGVGCEYQPKLPTPGVGWVGVGWGGAGWGGMRWDGMTTADVQMARARPRRAM